MPERNEINGEELPSFRVVGLQSEVYHVSPEDAAEMKSNRLRGSVSVVTVLLTAVAIVTVTADTDVLTRVRTAATCELTADTDILTRVRTAATCELSADSDILTCVRSAATCELTADTDILTYITDILDNF